MALHGVTIYGTDFYGYDIPPAYRADPFVATSISYSDILITWSSPSAPSADFVQNPPGNPTGAILAYRLIKNRYGFPVDQDDGEVLIDSFAYPGSQFTDTNAQAGAYQYYALYLLIDSISNTWVRSATTACLAINNYGTGLSINELTPTFYKSQNETFAIIPDIFPASTLDFFCLILGWGIDYLKTQYDTYLNVNNPWTIPYRDLFNLATQLGLDINPDIHPYTLRKAVYYNAVINQQRGTVSGIEQEVEVLTGWATDISLVSNMMLNNDQSAFLSPQYPAWSQYLSYLVGEFVSFGNYIYKCIALSNIGNAPTGLATSNTWWQVQLNVAGGRLLNSDTQGQSTWEIINPNNPNGLPIHATGALNEVIGINNPKDVPPPTRFNYNGLQAVNTDTGAQTLWVRSVSRSNVDKITTTTDFHPDLDQVTGEGIPVPFVRPQLEWNGTSWNTTTRYGTNNIVTYSYQPFMATRASTNLVPPYATKASSTPDWSPIGFDSRIRICSSAYTTASTTGITATPFVEWYDSSGNFINRVFGRNIASNVAALPNGFAYDSFTAAAGNSLNGRTTDDGGFNWSTKKGGFTVSPFYQGCVYPNISTRSYSVVNAGVSDGQVAATFVTNSDPNFLSGILFRWQDDSNYFVASMSGISVTVGGTSSSIGTYSFPANLGDRLLIQLSGSTITALINNTQVLQITNSSFQSSTNHGLIYDSVTGGSGGGGGGGSVTVTNPGPEISTVGTPI